MVQFEIHRAGVPNLPVGNQAMPKREMRIVKYIGSAPYLAVSTYCSQQFKVTSGKTFTVEDMKTVDWPHGNAE
jgi:hypothetical protein